MNQAFHDFKVHILRIPKVTALFVVVIMQNGPFENGIKGAAADGA